MVAGSRGRIGTRELTGGPVIVRAVVRGVGVVVLRCVDALPCPPHVLSKVHWMAGMENVVVA